MTQDPDDDGAARWPTKLRVALLLVGVAIGVIAAPMIYAQVTTNDYQIGENATYTAPDGLSIEAGEDITTNRQHPFPNSSTVDFGPEAEFQADGDAHARVSGLEDPWLVLEDLDVTSNELRVHPEDQSNVHVQGAATRLEVSALQLDDGQSDLRVTTSGETTLTVWDLPADTAILAVDADTGELIEAVETDANGGGTFTVSESRNVEFVSQTEAPTIIDVSPADGTTLPDYETEISATVEDADFAESWGDTVTVTFYDTDDGTEIHSETISSASTVNATWSGLDMGANSFNVTATDEYGNETSIAARTVTTPNELAIRDEQTLDLIDDASANVTVTLFPDDADEPIVQRTTDDGTVNLSDVPPDQPIIIRADADGYYTRTVIIQDITDQQTVYLLSENATAVESRFVLEDITGEYPEESALYISKPITENGSTQYRVVHADRFGVDGVTANLLEDERYRLRIEAPDGTTQDLGPYRAATSETVAVQPGTAEIDLSQDEEGWQSGATLTNQTIYASFEDPQNATGSVTMTVYERGNRTNQLAASETYHDLGSVSTKWTLSANQSEEEWVVVMDVERGGETSTVEHVVGANPEGVIEGLSGHWRALFGVVAIFLFGGIFSVLNRAVGAVMVSLVGGILWWVGWLAGATAGVAVVIYMFVAFTYAIYVASR